MAEENHPRVRYGVFNDEDGKPVALFEKDRIGSGGEADVFLYRKVKAIKIFKKEDEEKEKKLKLLLTMSLDSAICKPEKLLYIKGTKKIAGYVMPYKKGKTLGESVFQPLVFQELHPRWTRVELTEMAIRVLEAIADLHSKEILIGDVNSSNIIIGDHPQDVTFIDVDSFQIEDYACKVGNVAFISPRLQGQEFAHRTVEDEQFAISTLLFMIFLLGKPPYRNEGNNLSENIKQLNFAFPFEEGEQASVVAPKGIWDRIWNALPYDIRKAFYRTFKKGESVSTDEWITLLKNYKSELEVNNYSREILPKEKSIVSRSLNMNRKDISEQDAGLRDPLTLLNSRSHNIGVLELSTKAVKLLVGKDDDRIRNSIFSFGNFTRYGTKTHTGSGLDDMNRMDMQFFEYKVLPTIKDFVGKARQLGVGKLYTVATAAYRNADNRDEIISFIKRKAGINVCILKKEEEAAATITAFQFTTKNKAKLTSSPLVLMIDQGGGSTEVSLYRNLELKGSYSINLGTEVLRNYLFRRNGDTFLHTAILDTDRVINDRLKAFYNSPIGVYLKEHSDESVYCVALGTAITKATGKSKNEQQHDMILTRDRIEDVIREKHQKLITVLPTVADSLEKVTPGDSFNNTIDSDLTTDLGLRMYIRLLKYFKIDSVTVNGTGLWYGIYFQQLFKL